VFFVVELLQKVIDFFFVVVDIEMLIFYYCNPGSRWFFKNKPQADQWKEVVRIYNEI
jgi:hypothetical protein